MGCIIGNNEENLLSKIATGDGHGEESTYFDGWKAYDNDPFHPTRNPNGIIQMGLAENRLCFDLIEEWIMKNPAASICTAEGVDEFKNTAVFQDYHGLKEFRNAIANFMGKVGGNKVKFDPDRIVMSGGATGAHETIAFCLADPSDAFLVPTPYYPGFDRDLRWRTGVQLLPVICDSSNNFKPTIPALEAAYGKAQASNIKVKGLLITNPSNPLGTIYDTHTLKSLLSFATQNNIHLIVDEIYAGTVFTPQPEHPFTSIAEILLNNTTATSYYNPNLIHIIYSLSKDMGLPGFRVGVIYSYNDAVLSCARKMSSFGLVSTQTQRLLASLLIDDEFVEKFVRESKKRLCTRHNAFVSGMSKVGIRCLKSNAGLFVWMNLRNMLKEATVGAETDLWRVIINEVKLNVSPGSSFHCSEPGWFRVCFANMDDETMEVALRRIKTFVVQDKEAEAEVAAAKKKKPCRRSDSLKLSLSSRRFEDVMASPHSPIPQSPLVRART